MDEPRIGKVVDLEEFSRTSLAPDRLALDLRSVGQTVNIDELLSLEWQMILDSPISNRPTNGLPRVLANDNDVVSVGDVIRVTPADNRLLVLFRRGANSNTLFITERCNSFCLMCSQPPRNIDDNWRIQELVEAIPLLDADPWLGVTGGEPTLIGERLAELLKYCATMLPATRIHILTNGRRFCERGFAELFQSSTGQVVWGIPLYGDHAELHDYVVQTPGAFDQTVNGMYRLHKTGHEIEIRVVLVRPTVERLEDIASFLFRNFPFAAQIAFMGVESIGFARANRDQIWIDPLDYADVLHRAVGYLHHRGMRVSLYNSPLCTLPKPLWPFAARSISDWKQKYVDACASCDVRSRCGGFFESITPEWMSRGVHPIREMGNEP